MGRDHVCEPSAIHHVWDLDLEPVLAVESGDTVSYDLRVAGEGQVWPGATYEQARFDFDTIYNLCSLAGDLKIHEVVDAGVWNVGFTMPVFGGGNDDD